MQYRTPDSERARFEAAKNSLTSAGWKVFRLFGPAGVNYGVQRYGRAEFYTLDELEEVVKRVKAVP